MSHIFHTFASDFSNLHDEKDFIINYPVVHLCDDVGSDVLRRGTAVRK